VDGAGRACRQDPSRSAGAEEVVTADLVGVLAQQREHSRAQVARYSEIRAALEQLRVTATSRDRSVTVELAAGGTIVDLRLTPQAMERTPDALAGLILEVARSGMATVAAQTAARVEPLTGRRVDVSSIAQGRLPTLGAPQPTDGQFDEQRGADSRFLPEEE
jgi:DNA-binding protein YbaB